MIDMTALPVGILAQNGGGFLGDPIAWLPIAAILVLGYLMLIRPEQKKAADVRRMLEGIKKNDRVETIGGIIATVVSVKKDQGEVVLRTDEKTGAEVRVRLRAIAKVLPREGKSSDSVDAK